MMNAIGIAWVICAGSILGHASDPPPRVDYLSDPTDRIVFTEQRIGDQTGLRQIPDASGDSLVHFICNVAEPGSEIPTDGWGGYNSLAEHSYLNSRTVLSESGDPAHVAMPGVHRIAALLKRRLPGTHQGAVGGKYLDYYFDKHTFRFNRRTSRSRGMLFCRLMQQAVATAAAPYRQLVDGNHKM